MNRFHILAVVLMLIVLAAFVLILVSNSQSRAPPEDPPYVGIAFCGTTTVQAEVLIDKVKDYTNLFILDSGISALSNNLTAARQVCDYAYDAGLYLVVNLGTWQMHDWPGKIQFYNDSRTLYGDKFLGAYYDDEPGGTELDYDWPAVFRENSSYLYGNSSWSLGDIYTGLKDACGKGTHPDNYTLEAEWYVRLLKQNRGTTSLNQYQIPYLTSDYGLYWFDYLGGYPTLLAQFGWNNSVNQQIGLVRGAAAVQDKMWGVILTWKYMQAPYLDSPQNIYDQMVTAYNAGAKYIVIFNYSNGTKIDDYGGALTEEHFEALDAFWNNVVTKTPPANPHAEAVFVLPKDYGWGMRHVYDRIWGFWGADSKSPQIWSNMHTLLDMYGSGLDIVYDDPAYPLSRGNYGAVYYWNQTI
ncbi:MAG: hypothetical protein NWE92_11955 [Candidatus Bathyarchaeota archaeon]|nr:hypothetical protein [Candidatus Bathyarchaeota archaeon]